MTLSIHLLLQKANKTEIALFWPLGKQFLVLPGPFRLNFEQLFAQRTRSQIGNGVLNSIIRSVMQPLHAVVFKLQKRD